MTASHSTIRVFPPRSMSLPRQIIAICSTKGGVGKTTTTANLGAFLADTGLSVLLVDCDIQPTLSSYYPLANRAHGGLSRFITSGSAEHCISRTIIGCDIVISDDPEGRLQDWILHTPDGRVRLRYVLSALSQYDLILVDTQGAVSPLQDAGVLAADFLLSPIPPDILSAREFARGTLGMIERLKPMQHLGAPIGHLYGLIYRMDRTVDARHIAAELRTQAQGPSSGAITILDTVVPATVAYRDAASAKMPIHRWERRRRGPTASGLETLQQLVAELLPHLEIRDNVGLLMQASESLS